MKQIIKFTDVNVDGDGTDVDVLVQVEGKQEISKDIIANMEKEIEEYKRETDGEWDTDGVVNAACEYLETKGYMCDFILPDYEISF